MKAITGQSYVEEFAEFRHTLLKHAKRLTKPAWKVVENTLKGKHYATTEQYVTPDGTVMDITKNIYPSHRDRLEATKIVFGMGKEPELATQNNTQNNQFIDIVTVTKDMSKEELAAMTANAYKRQLENILGEKSASAGKQMTGLHSPMEINKEPDLGNIEPESHAKPE